MKNMKDKTGKNFDFQFALSPMNFYIIDQTYFNFEELIPGI